MEEGDGAGGGDSLFSLELLVESAQVEPRLLPSPLPASGPFRPAVALRLLDFPTLLVRAPHCVPGPLVPFGRGKSCLFRLRPTALRGLLRRSPLHALLLALPPKMGPARLLGSCSVSLATAAEELLLGTGPGGRRGRFPLRDLMGELVGELGLSYRLSNLGSTLLGHLAEGAAAGEPCRKEGRQPPLPATPLGIQREREFSLDHSPEVDRHSALECNSRCSFSSSFSETQPSDTGCGDMARELETEANVFCPPPMYYNCPAEDCCLASKASEPVMVAKPVGSVKKEENVLPSALPVKEEPSRGGQEVSPSPQALANAQRLRETLSQLPLLNALLVELSLLNNQTPQPGPSAVHPQLAWLYQNVEESPKTPAPHVKSVSPPREEKKTHRKERGRSPTIMLRRNHLEHLKCLSPCFQHTWAGFKASVYERKGSPEKNSKENSPPRRKLTYGMTNTLRLRLQQTNPGMLKVHEKREHRRKKQANVFMKGNISLAKDKTHRYSPERHLKPSGSAHSEERAISDQNVQFNENIETLIQCSVEQDCSTTRKEVTSEVQSNVAGGHLKNHENIKERCLFKKIGPSNKGRRLKVHLPRVSLQDADALENLIDMEAEKCVQDKDCKISVLQNLSQINNVESHLERKHSDDVIASCENGSYFEDFTKISVVQNPRQSNNVESHLEHKHSDDVIASCENGSYSEDFTKISVVQNPRQSNNVESHLEHKHSDDVIASCENRSYSEDFTKISVVQNPRQSNNVESHLEHKHSDDVIASCENGSYFEDFTKISVVQNPRQSNNVESHHECENSEDAIASCENGSYSEDFTNADSASLEVPLRVSEPLLVNPKQSHSDTEADSEISRKSQTSESISCILPIPSALSPVQTLKKTNPVKPNDQNIVDQSKYNGDDDSSPTRTLKEDISDHQDKKQENKISQAFDENKQVSFDLNSRGTKDQFEEKSLSLRTSQVSSYMPSNMSDLSELESNTSVKEEDVSEVPDITNQYKHVSELVVNKLPGYTM